MRITHQNIPAVVEWVIAEMRRQGHRIAPEDEPELRRQFHEILAAKVAIEYAERRLQSEFLPWFAGWLDGASAHLEEAEAGA